jgi:hypothetical protein
VPLDTIWEGKRCTETGTVVNTSGAGIPAIVVTLFVESSNLLIRRLLLSAMNNIDSSLLSASPRAPKNHRAFVPTPLA